MCYAHQENLEDNFFFEERASYHLNQRIILSRSEDIIFLEHEVMEYPKTRNVLLYETKSHKNGIVTEEEND